MPSKGIKLKPVKNSSNITAYGYDPKTRALHVAFKSGRTYRYADVPAALFARLEIAESKGSFIATEIVKGDFESTQVE